VKFSFIARQRETFPVGHLCRALKVSRSGFYAWTRRSTPHRTHDNDRLLEQIRRVHLHSNRIYGSPRVYRELRSEGHCIGKHRVARLMRLEGLRSRAARRFPFISTRRSDFPAAPNLVFQNFYAGAPDRLWLADITQVRTREGWLFLAVILDAFSRRIVGWATSPRPDQRVALEALRLAIDSRRPAIGLIHHSDRGGQYASGDYQQLLDRHGIVCSMSRSGNCYDNAMAESFFHSLKTEWVYHFTFDTRDQARTFIFEYIECFYNRRRLHSALGYRSPDQYEILNAAA